MNIHDLAARAADGELLSRSDARAIAALPESELPLLCELSRSIKERAFGDSFGFCAIISAKGGPCGENCAFCAQSARASGPAVPTFEFLETEAIVAAAKAAGQGGASRFSLVTSGKSLTEADFGRLLEAVSAVRGTGLAADVSPGILTAERMAALHGAGASGYHHNLETGPSFYPTICSSRTWEENRDSVRHAVNLGMYTCSGGLFGLGESWEDRIDLALELRELGVDSVPVNFLHPVPGTLLEDRPLLTAAEALKIIALLRFLLPRRHVRVCGGRHTVFTPGEQELVFGSGASGVMVGDYLTLQGKPAQADASLAASLGLRLETES